LRQSISAFEYPKDDDLLGKYPTNLVLPESNFFIFLRNMKTYPNILIFKTFGFSENHISFNLVLAFSTNVPLEHLP
jgi:hypothetical protein